jgi:hypothetical protein
MSTPLPLVGDILIDKVIALIGQRLHGIERRLENLEIVAGVYEETLEDLNDRVRELEVRL